MPSRKVTVDRLGTNDGNFAATLPLAATNKAKKGWQVKVKFQDGKQVLGTTSATKKVTVQPAPHASAKLSSVKVSNGNVTVRGSVFPKPTTGGAKLQLLALNTAAGSPDRFRVFKTVSIGRGHKQFTLHAKLKRGNALDSRAQIRPEGPSVRLLEAQDDRRALACSLAT